VDDNRLGDQFDYRMPIVMMLLVNRMWMIID
jgi:hypothetical protein